MRNRNRFGGVRNIYFQYLLASHSLITYLYITYGVSLLQVTFLTLEKVHYKQCHQRGHILEQRDASDLLNIKKEEKKKKKNDAGPSCIGAARPRATHWSCGFLRKLPRSTDLMRSHASRPLRRTRIGISAPAGPLSHTLR